MNNQDTQNISKSFKNVSNAMLASFIGKLEKTKHYQRKGYVPVSANSHFERFSYALMNNKISIVYDTKAKILSITAKKEIVAVLDNMLNEKKKNEITVAKQPKTATEQKLKISDKLLQRQAEKLKKTDRAKVKEQSSVVQSSQKSNPQSKVSAKTNIIKKPVTAVNKNLATAQSENTAIQPKTAVNTETAGNDKINIYEQVVSPNTFGSIKKEDFDEVLDLVRAVDGIVTKTFAINVGKFNELITVEVTNNSSNKVNMIYMPKKQKLSLSGRKNNLMPKVREIIQEYVTAALNKNLPGFASYDEKKLKKLIPSAVDFLSVQSKIDISIGLVDIYNDQIKLSDYSVLLVPPYRGLERFIYDLQAAEDIEVKMIGQAFEKDDKGNYSLKSGYRKKINSVVYNEVMSALYTEYFIQRHNFTHSDNTPLSEARVIANLKSAQEKFENLLHILEYNSKKLKEIGFSLKKEKDNKENSANG